MCFCFPLTSQPRQHWDAATTPITITHCSISVFPQTRRKHWITADWLMSEPGAFSPESGLRTCVWKVRIWDYACISATQPINILKSSASSGTIEGEKCANINMPLKERWLGVHRTQVLLTQLWSRSNSRSPLGRLLFISHMAWPPVLLTQDREREMLRKPYEDMSRGSVWER